MGKRDVFFMKKMQSMALQSLKIVEELNIDKQPLYVPNEKSAYIERGLFKKKLFDEHLCSSMV